MAVRADLPRSAQLAALAALAALVGLLAGVEPKLAIAAAIGAAFVLVVFVDLAAGLALFGFFSFLELLQLGSMVSVGKLGGGLLAIGWLAVLATHHEARRDFLVAHPWMSTAIVAFLGWSLLSATWAADAGAAVGTTVRYLLNAILFLIVFTAVRDRRQLLMVTTAFVAGAVGATFYGLLHVSSELYAGRLGGSGLDPNELAATLVAGVALSVGLAANLKRSPGLRLVAVTAGLACLLGIFLTVSRGGMVALAISLLAAVLFAGRWRARVALLVGALAALTAVYFVVLAPPAARERITSATQGEHRVPDGRVTLWELGWRMAKDNPVHGVGAGNFRETVPDYLLRPGVIMRSDQVLLATPQPAHNTYLSVLAELGVVGCGLFLSLIAFSLISMLRAARCFRARGDPGCEILARSFAVGLIGVLAADFFLTQELSKQLWLLLGFGPVLLAMSRDPGEPAGGGAPAAAPAAQRRAPTFSA